MTMPPPPPSPPQQPYPPNPYGAAPPPYPYPYPWGGPPVPPPRRGLGPGAIIGIVLGSIAAVVCLGLLAAVLLSNSDDGSSPRYRLTVPRTLLHGRYTLAQDMTQTLTDKIGQRSGINKRDAKGAAGQYTAGSSTGPQVVTVVGLYGHIRSPKQAMKGMLQGINETDGTHVTTPAREITPNGSDEPVTCEVLDVNRNGDSGSMTVCGWSDHSTMATASFTPSADLIDLHAAANQMASIRDDMRVRAE
ncbi:hypothetical protein ACIHFE_34045 [Streptomyces sp. NPDC052396]|uniref:hypothetical protein n=1 Tax=Streptomyces sp. NPDC052396 TaxID=3365689 RepID=UPI0037D04724